MWWLSFGQRPTIGIQPPVGVVAGVVEAGGVGVAAGAVAAGAVEAGGVGVAAGAVEAGCGIVVTGVVPGAGTVAGAVSAVGAGVPASATVGLSRIFNATASRM